MAQSYRSISPDLARQIKLVMADVDGTLNSGGDSVSSSVSEAISRLEGYGISVGLVSGRTDALLKAMAQSLGISGPIIAENGGIARLTANGNLVDLGYSRQPAVKALKQLKTKYPGCIKEREDNSDRLIDIVFWAKEIPPEELRSRLKDVQLLDSGYILHLMQNGISKGKTLMGLLGQIGDSRLLPEEVLVIGDSTTDLSLFELFPESVLIPNPRISAEDRQILHNVVRYVSDHEHGEGFTEVALHILNAKTLAKGRSGKTG